MAVTAESLKIEFGSKLGMENSLRILREGRHTVLVQGELFIETTRWKQLSSRDLGLRGTWGLNDRRESEGFNNCLVAAPPGPSGWKTQPNSTHDLHAQFKMET